MNQFTEQFSVLDLARRIGDLAGVKYSCIPNPRVEKEDHYYNPKHTALEDLGLEPTLLTDQVLMEMLAKVGEHAEKINHEAFLPTVKWRQ